MNLKWNLFAATQLLHFGKLINYSIIFCTNTKSGLFKMEAMKTYLSGIYRSKKCAIIIKVSAARVCVLKTSTKIKKCPLLAIKSCRIRYRDANCYLLLKKNLHKAFERGYNSKRVYQLFVISGIVYSLLGESFPKLIIWHHMSRLQIQAV